MILSQLFCKKKQVRNDIFCKRCNKFMNHNKDPCHKDEQMPLIDFEDDLLQINSRLTHENAFQIFDFIQKQDSILLNLEELRLTFVGGYQTWVDYSPNPLGRNFKTWKGCQKKLVNLKKLVINLSETRLEESMDVFFQGFEDLGEIMLEELELDFFSIFMVTNQLIQILQKISTIKSLKKFQLNIGKLGKLVVTNELIDQFNVLFQSLHQVQFLSLNISSMQIQDEQLESLLGSILQLSEINSLKLSLKNCKLNVKIIPTLNSFLETLAPKLALLDLDISYNSFGEDITKTLVQSLKQYKQLTSFSINLKGFDSNFNNQDYYLLLKLVYKIFKLSIQRYKSTQNIQNSLMKKMTIQLPLTFLRQNLQLFTQNNIMIQNIIKYGPLIYQKLIKTTQLCNTFRRDILNEMVVEFIL